MGASCRYIGEAGETTEGDIVRTVARKRILRVSAIAALFMLNVWLPFRAEAQEERVFDIELLVDMFYDGEGSGETLELDTNGDGRVDYLMRTSQKGEKSAEVLDYDHNGTMDDFYYYEKGTLVRREIDSNADGKIDIWVYLDEGVYVKRYERDLDFDGIIELVKDYEEEAQEREKKRSSS